MEKIQFNFDCIDKALAKHGWTHPHRHSFMKLHNLLCIEGLLHMCPMLPMGALRKQAWLISKKRPFQLQV
jgi:hypothetical protein